MNYDNNENGIVLTEEEQGLLKKTEQRIYDTCHSPKNKEALPIALFFGVIAIIFKNALLWECIIWGIYYCYCSSNNEKWKNSPMNIQEREYLLNFKRKLLNGELRKYHL